MPLGQNSKCGRNRVFSHRVGHLELSPKKELTYFKKSPKTHHFYCTVSKEALSRIRNILMLIRNILVRIQILRSLPLTNGSGSGSPNNIRILRILILMRSRIRYTGTLHSHNSSQFLDTGRIRSRIRTCGLRMRIREAKKHTDPMDAYPVTLLKE